MSSFEEFWQSKNASSKITMSLSVILILILAMYLIYWVFDTRYEPLFIDIEPELAANVIAELEQMKVPYKINAIDKSILVPGSVVDKVRLKLTGTEVALKSGSGFELFDNSDFGMTEFAQKINYQRALEGEIARTISSINEIKYARVHLVLPESGLFKQNRKPPSAAVTLFMKGDHQLSLKQISGIQRIVAASVSGLELNAINISDQDGLTLNKIEHDENTIEGISGQLEKKRQAENYLRDKVVKVLQQTFGEAKTVISVDVTLNMDQVRTTRETVLPNKKLTDGVTRKKEISASGQVSGNKQGKNITTEYEYTLGRKVDQIVMTPGSIKRLSIGVLVPNGVDEKRVTEIRELIAMTVGVDYSRGDAIAVFTGISNELLESYKHQSVASVAIPVFDKPIEVPVDNSIIDSDPAKIFNDSSGPVDLLHGAEIIKYIENNQIALIILVIFLFLLLVLIYLSIYFFKHKSTEKNQRLTNKEYQKILTQLNQWLDNDDIDIQQHGERS